VRIGLAVSDPTGSLCTPFPAVRRSTDRALVRLIADIAVNEEVTRIVVGLPVTMEGRRGTQAQAALAFCNELRAAVKVPVDTWDERLSSVEAQARLREAGQKPSRDKGRVDSVAAALILESYLAAHRE
jgi:putative holliday junction resolvase